jgi:hypothetical protein
MLRSAAWFLAPAVATVGTWLAFYERPESHAAPTPFGRTYWEFLLNLVSNGFGVNEVSLAWGFVALAVAVPPLAGLALAERRSRRPEVWIVGTALLSVLAVLAGIALGRSGFPITSSKDSRFTEFGGLLPLLSAAAWSLLLRRYRPRLLAPALVLLWLGCSWAYADEWSFRRFYEPVARSRQAGADCARAYYFEGGDGLCRDIWWDEPMGYLLEYARTHDLSFYRSMKEADERGER